MSSFKNMSHSKQQLLTFFIISLLCLTTFALLLKFNLNLEDQQQQQLYDDDDDDDQQVVEAEISSFKSLQSSTKSSPINSEFNRTNPLNSNAFTFPKSQFELTKTLQITKSCDDSGFGLDLLVIVYSAPESFDSRSAIRATWGKMIVERGGLLFFLLGQAESYGTQGELEAEDAQYSDLLQGDFPEQSESLKSIAMIRFIAESCSRVRYAFKTPDTAFVNSQKLTDYCETNYKNSKSILGSLASKWKTPRSPEMKYYLPVSIYKYSTLPDFLLGPSYLLSGDSVKLLYKVIGSEKVGYYAEDLFITGFIAEKAKVTRKHEKMIGNTKVEINECSFGKMWTSLGYEAEEIRRLWELVWSRKCLSRKIG